MVQAEKRTLDITTRVRDQLTKPFRRIGAGIKRFASAAARRFGQVKAALFSLKGAVAGLAIVFAARRLFAGIKATADELDELVKTSQRIGVTVEALQELKFISGLAGTELKSLTAGLVVFSKNIEQAREEVVLKKQAMDTLGLTFEDVAGENLNIIPILQKVSKAWNESTDATARNNAVAELFGRTGSKLGPILEEGAAGIAAQAKQARELNAVHSEAELRRAADFNDALLRLTTTLRAMAEAVFIEVAPTLSATFDELRRFVIKNKDSIKEQLKSTARSIADFALSAAESMGTFADVFRVTIAAASTFTATLELGVLRSVKAFKQLSGASETELAVFDAAIEKSRTKMAENAGATADSFEAAMQRVRDSAKKTREIIDKAGEPPEREPQERKPLTVVAADLESEKFALLIDDLEVRQLEGYKRQVAALTLRYDVEKARIAERADALRATPDQLKQANELLRAEFDKTRASLDGGFFAGVTQGFKKILGGLSDLTSAGKQFAAEVGSAIANEGLAAINDWVDGTKSLKEAWKDLGDAILAELQQILVKTLVLRAVGGVFDFGASLFGGTAKAQGGITPPIKNPIPLKKYAHGGIATGPQFALFGEGRQNEAFVPLPDGRNIPVTMTGGGGAGNVFIVNNVSAIDQRGVAAFFEQNTRQLTAIYDRALISRNSSRNRVRGVR